MAGGIKNKRCKICNSEYCALVDRMLILGYRDADIVKRINSFNPPQRFNAVNIHNHKKHLSPNAKMLVAKYSKSAEIVKSSEEMPKIIGFILEFVERAAGEILSGDEVGKFTKDLVDKWFKAIDILMKWKEIEDDSITFQYQQLIRMFEVFSKIVREVSTKRQMEEIQAKFDLAKDYIEGIVDYLPDFKALEGEVEEEKNE